MVESRSNAPLKREIRQLRIMLCSALQILEANDIPVIGRDLEHFWKEHKEEDRRRVKREIREANAKLEKAKKAKDLAELLNRLSPYERSLLDAKFIRELEGLYLKSMTLDFCKFKRTVDT